MYDFESLNEQEITVQDALDNAIQYINKPYETFQFAADFTEEDQDFVIAVVLWLANDGDVPGSHNLSRQLPISEPDFSPLFSCFVRYVEQQSANFTKTIVPNATVRLKIDETKCIQFKVARPGNFAQGLDVSLKCKPNKLGYYHQRCRRISSFSLDIGRGELKQGQGSNT
jgi:hypothetical protein